MWNQLTFGELFAGIGGFSLGLERAGMQCKWQVEIDDFARRVLHKHWPEVPRHDDVRTFPPAEDDYSVDIICGGFPCQDISVAGKGAGLSGERSGLWYEFARVIGELRPRYVIVENVAALLHRGMDTVLADISTLGYDSEWHVIPASAVGAPHQRERVWIVAYSSGEHFAHERGGNCTNASGGGTWRDNGGRSSADDRWQLEAEKDENVADANGAGREKQRRPKPESTQQAAAELSCWWETEPAVGRVVDGVSHRVDRLRCLGNAVVPQVVELIGRAIMEVEQRCSLL